MTSWGQSCADPSVRRRTWADAHAPLLDRDELKRPAAARYKRFPRILPPGVFACVRRQCSPTHDRDSNHSGAAIAAAAIAAFSLGVARAPARGEAYLRTTSATPAAA